MVANTKQILTDYLLKYPHSEIEDIFKFLYQSSFGCEHLVGSLNTAIQRIKDEANTTSREASDAIEPLDGNYSRVHLGYLKKGLSAETLGRLFYLSAKKEKSGHLALSEKLTAVQSMAENGELGFRHSDFDKAFEKWKADGFPPIHHSERFKKEYRPSYRVISNDFTGFLPLLAEIDKRLSEGSVTLAIEGGSASGKSTLGGLLEQIYGCALFHMDDFFLRPEQRTPKRFAEPGGNVDRERFLEEVLIPLSRGECVCYRRFDCSSFTLLPPTEVAPKKLTVIEGAYSMHPDLAGFYDLSVFLEITPDEQKKRIKKRNSEEMAKRFFAEWIPLEHRYFEFFKIKDSCDIVISTGDL